MNTFNKIITGSILLFACETKSTKFHSLQVTVTAYNSLAYQTKALNPNIAAWGDTLKPGMKVIAVSRDLLDSGLVHNKEVIIEGFEGVYLVKDKMNRRYTKRIDIYMGVDVKKARKWGKQKRLISWEMPLKKVQKLD